VPVALNPIVVVVLLVVVVVIPTALMVLLIVHGEKSRWQERKNRERGFEVKLTDHQSVKEVEKERD
jgi:hypothetical protein